MSRDHKRDHIFKTRIKIVQIKDQIVITGSLSEFMHFTPRYSPNGDSSSGSVNVTDR